MKKDARMLTEAAMSVPLAPVDPKANTDVRIDVHLIGAQARGFRRLRNGLDAAQARLLAPGQRAGEEPKGRPVHSAVDAVRWICERLADLESS